MENINKIWGTRSRILLDDHNEIDLLKLKKNTFCSTHTHKDKINVFILVNGKVKIETEIGYKILMPNDEWTVYPLVKHRFVVLEDSVMLELAYVRDGKIYENDINRESLGGKIIDGVELTIDDLKAKGLLNL